MLQGLTAAARHPHPAEQTLSLRPLALSAAARDALARGAALVQAGHRLGASLILPGTDDAAFLSAPGIGLFPAHIVVRARDLDRVLDALDAGGRAAGMALSLRIEVRGVRVFLPRLAPLAAALQSDCAQANIAAAGRWLRAHPAPLGLGAPAAELLGPAGRWYERLAALQGSSPPAEPGLRALLGRGAGATPAGDDILVGALAYAWATQGGRAPVLAAMRKLAPEFRALTTGVGATYLRAAIRGEFGSHLLAWVRTLPRVSPPRSLALARRVAGHGATSGYDTLLGFIAAAEAAGAGPRSIAPETGPNRHIAAS